MQCRLVNFSLTPALPKQRALFCLFTKFLANCIAVLAKIWNCTKSRHNAISIAPGDSSCTSPADVRTAIKRFCGCFVNSSISFKRPNAICAACNFLTMISIECCANTSLIMASNSTRFCTRFTYYRSWGFAAYPVGLTPQHIAAAIRAHSGSK